MFKNSVPSQHWYSSTTNPLKSLINSVNLSQKLFQLADPLGTICAGNHRWNIHT